VLKTINSNMKGFIMFSIVVLGISLNSCYYDKADKLYPSTTCDTAKMNFSNNIKPILTNNCLSQGCHTTANATASIILDTYAGTKETIVGDKLINALKYLAGGSKNMPPAGKISDCDISKVEAWIKRG
jgi:hypothetical protein